MDFLSRLLDLLFPPRDTARIVRNTTAADIAAHLSPTTISIADIEVTALLPFRVPLIRALVHEAKYRSNERAQELLAQVLGGYLSDWLTTETNQTHRSFIIVPIPLSRSRLRERGFNQCEVLLTKAFVHLPQNLHRHISLQPYALIRIRDTEHQARLTRVDRQENVRDAFVAPYPLDPQVTYIIFDDVVTTGATFATASTALRAAGAIHILPLALTR